MKSVKTMLLGIAVLILASFGYIAWIDGVNDGAVIFFPCLIIGLILCLRGYFRKDQ